MKINMGWKLIAWALGRRTSDEQPAPPPLFSPPAIAPGVVPDDVRLAMDDAFSGMYQYANLSNLGYGAFMGYPALAQMTQIAEYRMLSEKTAMAMVRKWVDIKSTGEGEKTERIKIIVEEMERLKVRELFQQAATQDGFFGRAQLFVDLGEQDSPELALALVMNKAFVYKKLRKFKLVEAMYTYPDGYSATNPLSDNYYAPSTWFVMGQRVHSTRLLTFVGRPVPDILKPVYNFGGLSMSQLSKPYVDNWLKTRSSVNKMISNYSTSGIKTNMGDVLMGGDGDDLIKRAEMYTGLRDNQGLLLMDKETEEFFQYNTPLTTLDALQAQAQEHMAGPSSMPLSILLGITPTGLNASSEGEIRTYYDYVLDMQRILFGPNLETVIKLIQLSKFGDIDPSIFAEFIPLWQQSADEIAANRKADAETAAAYIEMGVLRPEEVRERLSNDENSGYSGLRGAPPEQENEEDQDGKTDPAE